MIPLVIAGIAAGSSLLKSGMAQNAAADTWEQQVKAANINTARQQTALKQKQRGVAEQYTAQRQNLKISSMQEQGRQVAASGGSGVTGRYVDRAIQATANRAGRDIAQSRENQAAMERSVETQVRNMWSQYETNASSSLPEMDWGSAILNAGISGLAAYATAGGSFGAQAAAGGK